SVSGHAGPTSLWPFRGGNDAAIAQTEANMVRRLIAGAGGILLAAVLGQFPEYAQQYTQPPGGAVDGLRIITAEFDRAAQAGGLDREAALARYGLADDGFLAEQGQSMTRTFARYEELSRTLARIEGAGPIERF